MSEPWAAPLAILLAGAAQKNSSPTLAATISAATPDQALKAAIDAD